MPTTILRPYYLTFRNRFKARDRSKHAGKRDLLLLFVLIIIMACIFVGCTLVLRSLAFDSALRIIVPVKILGLLFYAFFVLLLISNTVACVGNIYNAQNMNLLLTTPTSNVRLFFAKLFESIFETSLMFIVFLSPVALSYAYCLDLKPGFFLGSTLILIPFLLIPSGIAVVLSTFFVQFASVVWKRGLFLVFCVLGIAVWALLSLVHLLGQVQLQRGGTNAIVQLVGLFDNPNPLWLPSRWASDLISYFITGQANGVPLKLSLLVMTAIGTTSVGFLIFDRFLLTVRSTASTSHLVEDGETHHAKKADSVRRLLEGFYNRLPLEQQTRAIVLKDLTSMIRDRAQSLQLLMYLGIAAVYIVIIKFMSAALHLAPVALQAWWAFLASINILFAGFIITAVMTRLVYPSISLEGKAFWVLVTGPIELRKLIEAKVSCWRPLTIIIATTLLLAGVFVINPAPAVVFCTIYIGICMSIGATALAVGIGSMFASFEWESPNQISAGFGTLVLLLGSLTLVVVTLIPASVMTFITMVPAFRAKIGSGWWQLTLAVCSVLVLGINVWVGRWIEKKGAESLQEQRKY